MAAARGGVCWSRSLTLSTFQHVGHLLNWSESLDSQGYCKQALTWAAHPKNPHHKGLEIHRINSSHLQANRDPVSVWRRRDSVENRAGPLLQDWCCRLAWGATLINSRAVPAPKSQGGWNICIESTRLKDGTDTARQQEALIAWWFWLALVIFKNDTLKCIPAQGDIIEINHYLHGVPCSLYFLMGRHGFLISILFSPPVSL